MSKMRNFEEISNGRPAYLTGWIPAFEYVNNRKTDTQIGIRYFIALPGRKYETASVLVKDMTPLCSNEEIQTALGVGDFAVEFVNFQAHWYHQGGQFKLACTADAIREVKR